MRLRCILCVNVSVIHLRPGLSVGQKAEREVSKGMGWGGVESAILAESPMPLAKAVGVGHRAGEAPGKYDALQQGQAAIRPNIILEVPLQLLIGAACKAVNCGVPL